MPNTAAIVSSRTDPGAAGETLFTLCTVLNLDTGLQKTLMEYRHSLVLYKITVKRSVNDKH